MKILGDEDLATLEVLWEQDYEASRLAQETYTKLARDAEEPPSQDGPQFEILSAEQVKIAKDLATNYDMVGGLLEKIPAARELTEWPAIQIALQVQYLNLDTDVPLLAFGYEPLAPGFRAPDPQHVHGRLRKQKRSFPSL